MKIAVLAARSLQGSGFAKRVTSMLGSYLASGQEVDLFHYRRAHEKPLHPSIVGTLNRYVTVPLDGGRYRQHATFLPPLAWQCIHARAEHTESLEHYDVVQAETSATWGIARQIAATKRLVVFHDDDAQRIKSLAKTGPGGPRRAAAEFSAMKYSRWQRVVMNEADRIWFVSDIERDRLATESLRARTRVIPNGADDEYWGIPNLNGRSRSSVLFVGPGFYEANVSGLRWFMDEVWPLVQSCGVRARVRVVGVGWDTFPPHPDVSFVGWRESLAEEYASAGLVIAPLFAGGGTKIKVLEAMAAARPVVTTPVGAEGLPSSVGIRISQRQEAFAAEVVRLLTDFRSSSEDGAANREAAEGFQWSSVWQKAIDDLDQLIGQPS